MNYLKNLVKKDWPFLFILGLAFFLRFYRLDRLTTFGGDQGQDFLVIKDMVLYHKWTLLGIKTSIGAFFQGPVYLYLLYPFFFAFRLQPIAGAFAALFFSLCTVILLYITCSKYFSRKTAIFSTLLFAVSPEFVIYGNTPLYQNLLPFFIVLSIYLFLYKRENVFVTFLVGVVVGVGVELHLLNISFALAYFIFYLLFSKNFKKVLGYLAGAIVGVSPTIFFELRHQFLNVQLVLNYHNSTRAPFSFSKLFYLLIKGAAKFLAGNSLALGFIVFTAVIFFLFFVKNTSPNYKKTKKITFLTFFVTLLLSFKFSALGAHYFLPVWVLFVILLPFLTLNIFSQKIAIPLLSMLIIFNLSNSFSQLNNNHGYSMPPGLTLAKLNKAGRIISVDSQNHTNFNVASILDGNTRNYPLRYTTEIYGAKPEAVESYLANDYLYLLARPDKEKIYKNNTWEVNSLKPFTFGKKWDLGDNIYLYRLDRTKKSDEN